MPHLVPGGEGVMTGAGIMILQILDEGTEEMDPAQDIRDSCLDPDRAGQK
jgi:hypothetical protein